MRHKQCSPAVLALPPPAAVLITWEYQAGSAPQTSVLLDRFKASHPDPATAGVAGDTLLAHDSGMSPTNLLLDRSRVVLPALPFKLDHDGGSTPAAAWTVSSRQQAGS
jgi:hypothetical protein